MDKKRIYLNIKWDDLQNLKSIYPKKILWDRKRECNYIRNINLVEQLSQYLPSQEESQTIGGSPLEEFTAVITNAGLSPKDGQIISDGKWHSTSVFGGKRHKKNGAYLLRLDGCPHGFYINYLNGDKPIKWIYSFKPGEKVSIDKAKIAQTDYDNLILQYYRSDKAAEIANDIWSKLENYDYKNPHPYLENKKISDIPLYIKELKGSLVVDYTKYIQSDDEDLKEVVISSEKDHNIVVAIKDIKGKIRSLQFINKKGVKKLLKFGSKSSNFIQLGLIKDGDDVALCEGYSTGVTVRKVMNIPVIITLDSGNISSVLKVISNRYKKINPYIAADNDWYKKDKSGKIPNPGLKQSKRAIEENGVGSLMLPEFPEGSLGTDWNDFYVEFGGDIMKQEIAKILEK